MMTTISFLLCGGRRRGGGLMLGEICELRAALDAYLCIKRYSFIRTIDNTFLFLRACLTFPTNKFYVPNLIFAPILFQFLRVLI